MHQPSTRKHMSINPSNSYDEDASLMRQMAQAVHSTGQILLQRFNAEKPPADLQDLLAMIDANDEVALKHLRPKLLALRPQAQWLEDEKATGLLPSGEWWVVDPVEGNVNHIHGMGDWSVTATLVRNNKPILTVVDEPLTSRVYTAQQDGGAFLNGQPIRISPKHDLRAALVGTGQATPSEAFEQLERLGHTITEMLNKALLVKAAVPATMQLIHVAAGRLDAFWQVGSVLSGLVSGALLVRESGGVVSDWAGEPWTPESADFLAAAPGVHSAIVEILRKSL
jgi:myo-inositol-1(or 4)-monophosphatase